LQIGERRARRRLIQGNEIGRSRVVAAGCNDGGHHGAGQSSDDGRAGDGVMPCAGLDEEEIGPAGRGREIAPALPGNISSVAVS